MLVKAAMLQERSLVLVQAAARQTLSAQAALKQREEHAGPHAAHHFECMHETHSG